jgi:hypothetical protein
MAERLQVGAGLQRRGGLTIREKYRKAWLDLLVVATL